MTSISNSLHVAIYAGDDVLRAVVQRKFCIVGEIPA